jgi:hypothetical protein
LRSTPSWQESESIFLEFEGQCKSLKHRFCVCCRRTGIRIAVGKDNICNDCKKFKDSKHYLHSNLLPIWFDDDGVPQYHVPHELSCLTLAEKMLIQLASPFIPLQHIKNGTFGMTGHVCCFDQDLGNFVNTLPRRITDVCVLEVCKAVKNEIGGDTTRNEVYRVRKKQVGDAIFWLKKYNREYKHIQVDMSALNWLREEEEGFLPTLDIVSHEDVTTEEDDYNDVNADLGPSPMVTRNGLQCGDNIKSVGYIEDAPAARLSHEDTTIHNNILEAIEHSDKKRTINVQWPSNGPIAVSEYSDVRIFCRAFPWLFPGGFGDVKDHAGDMNKWGEYLLYYEDGRFTRDKFFCFFALNYITRNRNAKSGNWFINDFNQGGPENLDELKATIQKGDLSFVNRLTYYNKRVKGSCSYWFQKRAQVYSWINHHVEVGNGPPLFFITLSCGEYYWPDIIRLLKERMEIANDSRAKECYGGSSKLTEIINDYSIVIQEFFQKRVEIWLTTVGKTIFGIDHYWGRYEFAPGRGQIHIHFLAIRNDPSLFQLCQLDTRDMNGKEKRAKRLAKWASENLGLTASVDDGFDEINVSAGSSPCSIRFTDVISLSKHNDQEVDEHIQQDQQNLIKFCQVHECNGFCLRSKGSNKYVQPKKLII